MKIHTKTPWTLHLEEIRHGGESIKVVSKTGGVIALMKQAQGNKLENAEFIVRACNMHDELLDHVVRFQHSLQYEIKKSRLNGDEEGAQLKTLTLEIVTQSIAKAEGK